MDLNQASQQVLEEIEQLRTNFGRVIIGNQDILGYILKALLSNGHILIEGLPGLGKTLIVKTMARLLNLDFSRIQFTPDLMPADIIGVNIIVDGEDGHRHFRFEKGPIFTNILLADEINRASPKTQSALLQVMEERETTVFGTNYQTEEIFLTLATQNPIELKGTYPLPEAQLDRFMFKLNINYPTRPELKEIARLNVENPGEISEIDPVLNVDRIKEIKSFLQKIPVSPEIYDLASDLVYQTQPEQPGAPEVTKKHLQYGASPRGVISLLNAARVSAVMDGRFNLAFEDLRENYLACLRHRIILNFESEVENISPDSILNEIFESQKERR